MGSQDQQIEQQGAITMAKLLKNAVLGVLADVHTSMPGQVQTLNSDGTVDVQPLIQRKYINETDPTSYPVIPHVPVEYFGPKNGWLRWPLSQGDTGILLFAERSLDQWFAKGGIVDSQDSRMFHIADAFFIPGLHDSKNPVVPKGANSSAELAFGNAWIEITNAGKFKVKNGSTDLKTIVSDIVSMMSNATTSPSGGPIIFTAPNPASVNTEIGQLFA